MDSHEKLVRVFDESDRANTGATFWDWLRDDHLAWKNLAYEWIASSQFGDQIILTQNSPLHEGSAIYMLGPDVTGPKSLDANWPENLIYLGASVDDWLTRMTEFGDEYSVVPGSIDELVETPGEYRRLYRELNPGLSW